MRNITETLNDALNESNNDAVHNRKSILDEVQPQKPRLKRSFIDICEYIACTRETESDFIKNLFKFCDDDEVCEPEFKTKDSLISFVKKHRNEMIKGISSEDMKYYTGGGYHNEATVDGVVFTFPSTDPIFTTKFSH